VITTHVGGGQPHHVVAEVAVAGAARDEVEVIGQQTIARAEYGRVVSPRLAAGVS